VAKKSIYRKFFHGGAVVLGGQLHSEGNKHLGKGNPVFLNGKKVAETEVAELLLNKQQTDQIEKMIALFDKNKNQSVLMQLGQYVKHIVDNETVDKSGKYAGIAKG
jgi:hypothetical protein